MKNSRIVIIGWADSVHVQRWCRGLSERGFIIKLVSVGGAPLLDIDTIILPRRGGLSYLFAIPQVKKEVQVFKPALVHAHYAAGNGLLGLCSGIRPLVTSVWGSDIDSSSNSHLVNQIVNKVLNGSERITVTSNFLKLETSKRVNKTGELISVIPFGVRIPSEPGGFRQSGSFKLCYLKAHKPVYGADVLIDAMAIVIKTAPEISLSIAGGKNQYTQVLEKKIAELGLKSNIRFTGNLQYEQVYSFISEHNVLVMPSRSEGFGVAAAEASACARPVIATNVGGIPEIVIDEKTGILVPPNDSQAVAAAILKLANNVQMCNKMGLAGYEFIKKSYDWEKSLDQMSELYESVINERRQNQN